MNKILNFIFAIALGFFAVMFAIDRFGGTTIYTKGYCDDIKGLRGVASIPLEINMKDGKINSIDILENQETPHYLKMVTDSKLVEKFYGLTPKEAAELDIDAVSGATYSSKCIIKTVKKRMEIYQNEPAESAWTWQLIGILCCSVMLLVLNISRKKRA